MLRMPLRHQQLVVNTPAFSFLRQTQAVPFPSTKASRGWGFSSVWLHGLHMLLVTIRAWAKGLFSGIWSWKLNHVLYLDTSAQWNTPQGRRNQSWMTHSSSTTLTEKPNQKISSNLLRASRGPGPRPAQEWGCSHGEATSTAPHLASSGDSAMRWKILSAIMISIPFSLPVLSMISLQGNESTNANRVHRILLSEKTNFLKLRTELETNWKSKYLPFRLVFRNDDDPCGL